MNATVRVITKVHKRPASAILVEPMELWPGYDVKVLDEFQGKAHLWSKIYYIFNGRPYTGWVTKESLDLNEPAPSKCEKPISIPVPETKFFRNWTEAIVSIGVVLAALAFVAWAFM